MGRHPAALAPLLPGAAAVRVYGGWRSAGLSAFLALLLHIGAQHRIHAALVPGAFFLEIIEHVFIDANRNRLLLRRNDEDSVGPIPVVAPVGIILDRFFD